MKRLDFVIGASAVWEAAPLNVHHIARRLAKDNRVLFIESTGLRAPSFRGRAAASKKGTPLPTSSGGDRSRILKRLGNLFQGPRQISENLWVASPRTLPPLGPLSLWLNDFSLRWQVQSLCKTLGFENPVFWLFLPTFLPLLKLKSRSLSIYHCVDEYANNPGVNTALIAALEEKMVKGSDLVFASAQPLADRLSSIRPGTICLPNVSDTRLFETALSGNQEEPKALAAIPHPRLMFVGNLAAYKVDFELLERVLRARPDWQVVHIGPVAGGDPTTDPAPLFAQANFHSLGAQPHEQIPAYVRGADVCLLPNRLDTTSAGSFPLKFFEYLAVGKPIVGMRQLSLAEYFDRPDLCRLVATIPEFISAIETSLSLDTAENVTRRRELARGHSWEKRIDELRQIVWGRMGLL